MSNSMRLSRLIALFLTGLVAVLATGCKTAEPQMADALLERATAQYDAIILREGDVVRINFPGAPDLTDSYQIRRDGKISLKQAGEIIAAGKTLADLEKEILKLYEPHLVVKQVSVTLGSSSYPVFVIGAVLRPGKIMADRRLSVFEAVMEAGGFDFARANTKEVLLLREGPDGVKTFKFDLRSTLRGVSSLPFYVKPSDVIYVQEKFSWF